MATKLYGDAKKLQDTLKKVGISVTDRQMQDAIKTTKKSGGSKTTPTVSAPKSDYDTLSPYITPGREADAKRIISGGSTPIDTTGDEYLPYREGDTVPGKGVLLPDGTFRQAPTTTTNASTMTPADFVKYLVSIGAVKAEDQSRATGIATGTPETTDIMSNIPGATDIDNQIEKGEASLQALKDAAANESDESIRQRITDLFQREIDALNALYAQQKVEATKSGLAQLGTNRASQARFGLLGSTFGEAETTNINKQTEENKQGIDVRAQAALAPIYNQISTEILNARKAKDTARLTSAEDYLANLRNKKETINTIATNAIRNIIANKANPTDKDLEDMAKKIGVDPSTFKSDYKSAKNTEEADMDKLERELNKGNADLTMPKDIGDYTYMYDSTTGEWKNMGYNKVKTTTQTEDQKAALKNAQTIGAQWLDSVSGGDGYVSPNDYKKAKRDWILTGYPSQEFDKQFISYINPSSTVEYGMDKSTYESLKRPTLIINN